MLKLKAEEITPESSIIKLEFSTIEQTAESCIWIRDHSPYDYVALTFNNEHNLNDKSLVLMLDADYGEWEIECIDIVENTLYMIDAHDGVTVQFFTEAEFHQKYRVL